MGCEAGPAAQAEPSQVGSKVDGKQARCLLPEVLAVETSGATDSVKVALDCSFDVDQVLIGSRSVLESLDHVPCGVVMSLSAQWLWVVESLGYSPSWCWVREPSYDIEWLRPVYPCTAFVWTASWLRPVPVIVFCAGQPPGQIMSLQGIEFVFHTTSLRRPLSGRWLTHHVCFQHCALGGLMSQVANVLCATCSY